MSGSVNKVIIVGRLGQNPEIRRMQDGSPVVNLSVATSETWKDRNTGERREKTEWHRVVIFNEHLAKVAEQYLSKGAQVFLEGQIQTRKWQDQQGHDRYTTEIVLNRFRGELQMLDSKGEGGGNYGGGSGGGGGETPPDVGRSFRGSIGAEVRSLKSDYEDDIPFVSPWGER